MAKRREDSKQVNVRLPLSDVETLEREAKQAGVTVSELIRDRIAGAAQLAPVHEKLRNSIAKNTGATRTQVLEHLLQAYACRAEAYKAATGVDPLLREFRHLPDGSLVTGRDLSTLLIAEYTDDERRLYEAPTLEELNRFIELNEGMAEKHGKLTAFYRALRERLVALGGSEKAGGVIADFDRLIDLNTEVEVAVSSVATAATGMSEHRQK